MINDIRELRKAFKGIKGDKEIRIRLSEGNKGIYYLPKDIAWDKDLECYVINIGF